MTARNSPFIRRIEFIMYFSSSSDHLGYWLRVCLYKCMYMIKCIIQGNRKAPSIQDFE